MTTKSLNRCRLVLIAPEGADAETFPPQLAAAIDGGDIASLILPQYGMDDAAFQKYAEAVTPMAQDKGIAVIIAGDTRIADRVKADGIHIESRAEAADAIDRFQKRMMVGFGGAKTRDEALDLGEHRPDYLFFGRFGYDTKPEPHSRNLSLGEWWADVIEIPCIVLAGSELASVVDVAATRVEFVAVSNAVFADGVDPREAVAKANALLDAQAPDLSAA